MDRNKESFLEAIKKCWVEISFKDKGLIVIMIVLISQSIYNLFVEVPASADYVAINIIIRTSIASIFGYFLGSNFLKNKSDKKYENTTEIKLEILDEILENENTIKDIESKSKLIKNIDEDGEKVDRKFRCNTNLQVLVAITICMIIILVFIFGINFGLIKEGTTITIAQLRDLVSGSIGFLLGSESN